MLKKNQFVLIFLTIVTILAVWYIKTPTTAQTNNDVSSDDELTETTRPTAFLEMRDVIRNERSLESAQYDSIIADEAKTIDEKAAALSSKERLSSLTEKELLLELQVINLGYRDAFVMKRWFFEQPGWTLYFWGFTLLMFMFGNGVFKRLRVHFADVL